MENKQTAVEWLVDTITTKHDKSFIEFYGTEIDQAKAMEKEQIMNAFGVGCQVESTRLIGYQGMAEQYYNELYKTPKP